MIDYYKSNDDELTFYKINEDGKIFELDIYSANWDDVTDYVEFTPDWEIVTEEYVDSFRLFIYCEQSERYFQEHKKDVGIDEYKYGENYDFYFTDFDYDVDVVAVDDQKRIYYCSPKLMLPRMRTIEEIPKSWSKIELPLVMDYIEYQDSYFLTNMDLYFDENGNIQAYTEEGEQFTLNLKTHEMNIVFDKIQIRNTWKKCYPSDPIFDDEENEIVLFKKDYETLVKLHEYIEESKNNFLADNIEIVIGNNLKYYVDDFGKVYALDEHNNFFECNYENKLQIRKLKIDNLYNISRLDVMNQIKEYKENQDRINKGKLRITDLILYVDKGNHVVGFDQNNILYELSINTGELIQIDHIDKSVEWKRIEKKEAVYIQGIIKNELTKHA